MCSGRRRPADTAGFTLLDAVAATGLVGVALIGLSAGSITLARTSKTADAVSVATALAQQRLEALRSLPLGAAALAPGRYADAANPLGAGGTPGGPYTRTWKVSRPDTPRPGIKTITVRVAWTDSRPHETRLAAYVRCSAVPCP